MPVAQAAKFMRRHTNPLNDRPTTLPMVVAVAAAAAAAVGAWCFCFYTHRQTAPICFTTHAPAHQQHERFKCEKRRHRHREKNILHSRK